MQSLLICFRKGPGYRRNAWRVLAWIALVLLAAPARAERLVASNGLCLEVIGFGITNLPEPPSAEVATCSGEAKQQWAFDAEGRLVGMAGWCLLVGPRDIPRLFPCGGYGGQGQLRRSTSGGGRGRIGGSDDKCLALGQQTNPPDNASRPVVVSPCRDVPSQQWRRAP